MVETEEMEGWVVKDARCPRCGRETDIAGAVPMSLYCEPCDHQWINLANLEPPA